MAFNPKKHISISNRLLTMQYFPRYHRQWYRDYQEKLKKESPQKAEKFQKHIRAGNAVIAAGLFLFGLLYMSTVPSPMVYAAKEAKPAIVAIAEQKDKKETLEGVVNSEDIPIQNKSDYSVIGGGDLSVEFINKKMKEYNSPYLKACPDWAQVIDDFSHEFNVSERYAIGVFTGESGCGSDTTYLHVNDNNPGNLMASDGVTVYPFDTVEDGTRAFFKLIGENYIGKYNLTTPAEIMPVYCPSNNTYSTFIMQQMDKLTDEYRQFTLEQEVSK